MQTKVGEQITHTDAILHASRALQAPGWVCHGARGCSDVVASSELGVTWVINYDPVFLMFLSVQ